MSGATPTTANLTFETQSDATVLLPRPFSTAAVITSAVFLLPMMVFGIVANLLTLVVILSSKRLRTVVNILIISLSLSDLMSAIISPLNLYRRTWGFDEWGLPGPVCKLFSGVDIWTSGVTALHILLFSFVRLVSIKWPYEYRRIKKLTAKILIGCIWLITLGFGGTPGWIFYKAGPRRTIKWPACTLDPNWVRQFRVYTQVTYPILVFIPMLATAVLTIFTVAVMQRRRSSRRQKEKPPMFEAARRQHEESKRKAERKENHAMLQLGLIAGSFMFGYIPITTYAFFTTAHASITTMEDAVADWNYGMTAFILLRISECLNPIFYNVASNKLRRETFALLSKLFSWCCCGRRAVKKAVINHTSSETSAGTK